jgi:hypothetical protein
MTAEGIQPNHYGDVSQPSPAEPVQNVVDAAGAMDQAAAPARSRSLLTQPWELPSRTPRATAKRMVNGRIEGSLKRPTHRFGRR